MTTDALEPITTNVLVHDHPGSPLTVGGKIWDESTVADPYATLDLATVSFFVHDAATLFEIARVAMELAGQLLHAEHEARRARKSVSA